MTLLKIKTKKRVDCIELNIPLCLQMIISGLSATSRTEADED